ncbi:MAG TPA: hypothetical protein VJ952_13780 [Opitutales bacterium]|nr:hypothetical protein [Opitutales bacterium]
MSQKLHFTIWFFLLPALILGGCAHQSNPATETPSATDSGDKEVDSVAATYRATESHSLIEAERVEKDTGIVEEAIEE